MNEDLRHIAPTDIALIGMSCRMPGANDPEAFWARICSGQELLTAFDDDELRAAGISDALLRNTDFIRVTSLVDDAGDFDADFFGITPAEAQLMDPQHRLFLELCWLALEDAGYNPDTYSRDIGVFAGGGRHAYLRYVEPHFTDSDYLDGSIYGLQADTGNYGDFLATRVSYKLGLRGPSLNVQTACSTALVSVHLACQSLLLGESDIALAGAVNLHTPQVNGYLYEEGSICSPDGHLRPFDSGANGSVFGNGGGVVALRRLTDAIADGDRVVAVIKGTAINNDGADKMSFTAPSVRGQAEVVARAQRMADVDARTIGYIETHGTGTALGDPIEIAALTAAFGLPPGGAPFCALGAVKSQIGHLGPAAGIAGLIKAALVVERGQIPPCVNFETPNPDLGLPDSPFYIPREMRSWPGLRRAGVSAFGVGGTNAHVVLEQSTDRAEPTQVLARPLAIVVSAGSARALSAARAAQARHLRRAPGLRLGDVAQVLAAGRRRLRHRVAVTAATTAEAADRLADAARWPGTPGPDADLPVVFAFPGQGTQYVGAGRPLYGADPAFRAIVDSCSDLLVSMNGQDIRGVLLPGEAGLDRAAVLLRQARWAQPALFILEYALAKCLLEAGIQPEIMIGHSVGEYAAACLAGVFTIEEALRLVTARGQLMEQTVPGAMMAVGLSAPQVAEMLPPDLDIAGINAPEQTVVSGPIDSIARLEDQLAGTDVRHTVLGTSLAAHSALMDPVLAQFREVVAQVRPRPPTMAIASTLTGDLDGAKRMADPEYWMRHLRQPVRFMDAARAVSGRGPVVLVEAGPGRGLAGMYRQSEGDLGSAAVTPWVPADPEPDSSADLVGAVWVKGGRVDWARHLADQSPRRIALPGYPFQRSSFWLEQPQRDRAAPPPLGRRPVAWLQAPVWRPATLPPAGDEPRPRRVLALVPALGFPALKPLAAAGHQITELAVGDIGAESGTEQTSRLLARLESGRGPFDTLVVFCPDDPAPDTATLTAGIEKIVGSAFWPLLRIAAAAALRRENEALDILVATAGRHLLPGDTQLRPGLALMTGPVRVLPQEYPNIRIAEIDLASAAAVQDVGDILRAELTQPLAGATIAYRSGVRYQLGYEPVQQALGPRPWASGGSYLITGGLGEIGLAMAEEAAQVPGVRLTLTHRAPLPDPGDYERLQADESTPAQLRRRLAALARLRAAGATVLCVQADVTDHGAMRAVHHRFGPFSGIVHAAGVPGGCLIESLSPPTADRVLAPKVRGALVLDQAAADDVTEWTVLCSSVSAVVGGLGHTDYCSANAFLDAFASWRTQAGRRTLSLAYDAWTEAGMAVDEATRYRKARSSRTSPALDSPARPVDHQIFTAEWSDGNTCTYRAELSPGADWVVDEHRLAGHRLLPGTGIIEVLRAAAACRLNTGQIRLTGVDLLQPLAVPPGAPTKLAVTLEGASGELRATLLSRPPGAAWIENAVAWASALAPGERPTQPIEPPPDTSAAAASRGGAVTLGPRWDNVRGTARPDADTLIVECILPAAFRADLERFSVHPALLDTAAGSLAPLLADGTFLPISYERIDLRRPLPDRIRSRIVRRAAEMADVLTFDVEVQDEHGATVLDLAGYTLRQVDPDKVAGTLGRPGAAAGNRTLALAEPGDLTTLRLVPAPRPSPGPREVAVEVLATGLNFKEILIAAGLLEADQPDYQFGLECAGIVRAVGAEVTRLKADDPVMTMGAGCFAEIVTVSEELAHPIPDGLTFAQAASIPVAFTTAYDCIVNAAGLQAGERILVHAVTGGVGLAAVQIASRLGARVFGTAGSARKREFARSAGVELVMDSRSLSFERETIEAGGVDVLLNSMPGDYVGAGLRTLRPRGRFVELGRRDIVSGSLLDLSLFAPGRSFIAYYPELGSAAFARAFRSVADLLASREITPLPVHSFPAAEVTEAFLFMSQAQHIGKVVLVRPGADQVASGTADQPGPMAGGGGITRPVGLRALRHALALGAAHVLVSRRPLGANEATDLVVAGHVLEAGPDAAVHARPELRYEFIPPEGETETRLADIWASVLSIERVGREDNFLDLGGDSLYATQVVARIRAEFGVRISPSRVLGDVPLRVLAGIVVDQLAEQAGS